MHRPRLTAKELQRRYRQGERNFAGTDLSGESLRGLDLRNIDLAGSDLSHTDLRGTNFTDATLIDTDFTEAKTGIRRRWLILQLLMALTLIILSSSLAGTFWGAFIGNILNPDGGWTDSNFVDRLVGIAGIAISITFLALMYARGLLAALTIALCAISFSIFGAIVAAVIGEAAGADATGSAISFALVIVGGVLGVSAATISFVTAFATAGAAVIFCIIAATGAAYITVALAGGDVAISVLGASAGALLNAIVCFLIAKRALRGDPRDRLIRTVAVWFASWGGTNLVGTDLTDANFTKAQLKSAHLYRAKLIRTRFHLAQKVNLARLGKTILANFRVQALLITLRGQQQSYVGLNLQGANLIGADLADADFTEADLSQATLEGATLERANLTKTQALGTCFHQTLLTGATLEAWNIDSTTHLDGAICDYVYLLRHHLERRPNSGIFGPGEFTKLFQEVLDTIDLIFRNGVDWKAFMHTLKQVQVKYDNADLAVQSIENKGDGVVVVKLNAAPGTDKPAIHESFTEIYQLAFKEAEAQYKAQLNAKDDQISDYRQQNANMQEVVKLLAQRPITVDVKAISESKAMQGDDRSISIGGDATGNLFQSGDGNAAKMEFQQVTLPPPESVNIQAELLALHNILASLNDPVTNGIAQKLEAEAQKPTPDKSVISQTLETGLTYAKNLQGFAEAIDKLRPHVQNAAGWLGEHGHKLLPLVGLMAL